MQLATHSGRLERFLGPAKVEHLSRAMRDWYGPPIAVAGVPGNVLVHRGGDFRGPIRDGFEATWVDLAVDWRRRFQRAVRIASSPKRAQLNAGFSSLSDLIAEATAGKRRDFFFQKVGPTGVANVTSSLWRVGAQPAAGAAGSAAPGGRAPTSATTGAHPFTDPTGGDTQHIVSGVSVASVAGNTLLLYDRIFDVAKTMNSTTDEAVTGVPSRYQGSVGAADSPEGNFLFVEVGGTALAATAHNWANCLYRDEAGNDSQTLPSLTGNSGAIVDRLDHPVNQWFAPLASGDSGVKDIAQMDCSAAVATGAINFVVGHPITFMPCPLANFVCQHDFINSAFNLARIFDGAALALLEVNKPATTATTYNMQAVTVAG